MRKVAQIMGMPITIDIPASQNGTDFETVFVLLREIDKRFSPYKKNSELSRFNRGELNEKELSDEMLGVLKACKKAQKDTNGYFSAWYSKGTFEPSGYVKGWAIARAGELIVNLGYLTFCIGAGGDILAASDGEKTWDIGIQDPSNSKKILNTLSIKNGAVATSGNYERGEHIINPKTGKPAKEFLSFTVTGPDIIKTDILATAGFAMGKGGVNFINTRQGFEAYAYPGK